MNHTANPAVSFITLGVLDLERSRRFYAALGYVEHPRSNQHVAFFDLGGQVLGLFPRDALAEDASVNAAPPDAGIAFALDRVRPRPQRHPRVRRAGGARPGGRRGRPHHPRAVVTPVGWRSRLLRRSRWIRLGGRLESGHDGR